MVKKGKNLPATVATKKEKIGAGILFVWYFLSMIIIPAIIGGYFAGYYNNQPNIVGRRLFVEA